MRGMTTSRRVKVLVWLATAVAAVAALLVSPAAGAQRGHGVAAWPQSPGLIVTSPGTIVSVAFRLESSWEKSDAFVDSLQMPPGWRAVTPFGRLVLGADEPYQRIVAVSVPSDAPAGRYTLTYTVEAQSRPDVRDEETFTVEVERLSRLGLVTVSAPGFLVAGETATARLQVLNQGNTEVSVALTADGPDGVRARFTPAEVTLPIRGSAEVLLEVETPRDTQRSAQYAIKVAASDRQGEPARATVVVETVPRSETRPQLWRSIPTTLSAVGFAENGTPGYQVAYQGTGFLDRDQTRQIDFLLRGPDTTESSTAFGRRDEYRLRYEDPRTRVLLGDHSYRLSWLTDAAAYGRGAGIDWRPGPADLGIYHVEPRFTKDEGGQTGAHAGFAVGELATLRVNGLLREGLGSEGPSIEDGIASLELQVTPTKAMLFHGEVARSATLPGGSTTGTAWRLQAQGTVAERLSWDVHKVHASPGFTGYYQDTDVLRAMTSWTAMPTLRLRAYYQSEQDNPSADPALGDARIRRSVDLGATCIRTEGWCFDGSNRLGWSSDALDPDLASWEDLLSGRAVRYGETLRLTFQAASGVESSADAGLGAVARMSALGHFEPVRGRWVAAAGRYSWSAADQGSLAQGSRSLALTGGLAVGEPLTLRGEYRVMGADELSHQAQLGAQWEITPRWGLQLDLRWESARLGIDPLYAGQVALSRRIDLPVAPREDVGAVRGRLYDRSLPGQPGIEGVAVRMGGAVSLTDAQGRFTFHSLPPGTHHLYVDRHGLGEDRLIVGGQGQEVTVRGGSVTRTEVVAERGAEIRGEVVLRAEASIATGTLQKGRELYLSGDPESADRSIVSGLLIELRRGDEVIHRVTGADGGFVAQGLEPGVWTLRVDGSYLPEHYSIDGGERQLSLEPGVEELVEIAVRPHLRHIKMLEPESPRTLSTQ